MKGCNLSSKARKWGLVERRNVPKCWREPFVSSAMRLPSPLSTNLPPSLLFGNCAGFSTECYRDISRVETDCLSFQDGEARTTPEHTNSALCVLQPSTTFMPTFRHLKRY